MSVKVTSAALGVVLLSSLAAATAQTQPQPPLSLELNKLESAESLCRLNFVVRNDDVRAYDGVTADLVFFDRDGVILDRRTLELGTLKPKKTRVLSFPLESFRCDQLGEVLLNEALGCGEGSADTPDCTDRFRISHRGDVPFTK